MITLSRIYRALHTGILAFTLPLAITVTAGCDTTNSGDEVRAHLEGAKISLREAMQLASSEIPDGMTLEASLIDLGGDARFAIERHASSASQNVLIPLTTGAVAGVEADAEGTARAAELMQAMAMAITPEEAIAIAEAELNGEAFEFEFEAGEFEVEVLASDGVYEVTISAEGEVLEVEAEEDEDDEDGEDGEDDEDDEDGEDADADAEEPDAP